MYACRVWCIYIRVGCDICMRIGCDICVYVIYVYTCRVWYMYACRVWYMCIRVGLAGTRFIRCIPGTQYFWQGNHHIYGHVQFSYTVLANPTWPYVWHTCVHSANGWHYASPWRTHTILQTMNAQSRVQQARWLDRASSGRRGSAHGGGRTSLMQREGFDKKVGRKWRCKGRGLTR